MATSSITTLDDLFVDTFKDSRLTLTKDIQPEPWQARQGVGATSHRRVQK